MVDSLKNGYRTTKVPPRESKERSELKKVLFELKSYIKLGSKKKLYLISFLNSNERASESCDELERRKTG